MKPLHKTRLEAQGRLYFGCEQQHRVSDGGQRLQLQSATWTRVKVVEDPRSVAAGNGTERELEKAFADRFTRRRVLGGKIHDVSVATTASRSLARPKRTRLFAVPKGIASSMATSAIVLPYMVASTTARRCSKGNVANAARARVTSSDIAATSSGGRSLLIRFMKVRSSGAVGMARRTRKASIARFRVMVRVQEVTDPRRVSNIDACRMIRMNASWVTSSAVPGSPTIPSANPKRRR